MVGCATIYGLCFRKEALVPKEFLVVAITALTVTSALLISLHNSAIRHLTEFMKDCEQHARAWIPDGLLYFLSRDGGAVDGFHVYHRFFQRLAVTCILMMASAPPLFLTWNSTRRENPAIWGFCCALCVLANFLLILIEKKVYFEVFRLQWARFKKDKAAPSKKVSVPLPLDLLVMAQKFTQPEHRTISELCREALHRYMVGDTEWDGLLQRTRAKGKTLGIGGEADGERLVDEYRGDKR